ncbi:unnamed protein product [Rotaria sordida]|uniref:Uncharacterized protein n=1 Tax=Rotaria sordida TaxID=392033 RepID=A0A815XR59_9BILA|nr:unnamed protein product [Rotaria sordida]CAF4276269.1 unnamed protein product [Rotaria sordida]
MIPFKQNSERLSLIIEHGIDCREALDFFLKAHSTSFYSKATTPAQIKTTFSAGLRLLWSDVADIINSLMVNIHHEQLLMTQIASADYILSKVDNTTSIVMS